MKQELTFCGFCDAFRDMNRDENFSYEGKEALYEYLEDLYEDIGEGEYTLDVIALCCEYTEYKNLKEFNDEHSIEATSLDDISEHTQVIEIPNTDGFVIQQF